MRRGEGGEREAPRRRRHRPPLHPPPRRGAEPLRRPRHSGTTTYPSLGIQLELDWTLPARMRLLSGATPSVTC